jgi:hypothetical protein
MPRVRRNKKARRELAIRGLLARAQLARRDLPTFFELVMRHETTRERLKCKPHQQVAFKFVTDFPYCVLRQPVGTAKTYLTVTVGLWLLGQDPTQRGAFVAKAQGQSLKVIRMVSDYIASPGLQEPLQLVFPWLKQGTGRESWAQASITVERPPGIRDPSAVAVGLDGQIQGSRLSWCMGDDILDQDNTMTPIQREGVSTKFDGRFLSRMDPKGTRVIVTNTPWHMEDLTFQLEASGWPSCTMDILGNFWFKNVPEEWILRTGLLRKSTKREECWRLTAHDPDVEEETPLWPERYSTDIIDHLRATRLPHEFARLYLCRPFNEEASRCQRAWIETCKENGRGLKLLMSYEGHNTTFTGVDIGIGQGIRNDPSSVYSFELLPDGSRRILMIETGRWSGPDLADRVISHHDRYGSLVVVESNAAQDYLRQFALSRRPDLRIRAHTTNRANKMDLDFGVESVFTELKQGAWIIPCDKDLKCEEEVQKWIEECIYYQPPPAHTGDRLMACWIAREAARRRSAMRDPNPVNRSPLRMAVGGEF